jgi:shikimate dehydrogenase
VITARTRLAAVIGSPVTHSLSPALHNAGFASTGADWVYTAFEVAPGDGGAAVEAMRRLGIGGLSVTMPHKHDVAAVCDELDDAAVALRSVNTVVPVGGRRVRGYSTDGAGFVASVEEEGVVLAGRRVAVFGAGGAGRAIVDALARAGAAEILVCNRSAVPASEAAGLAAVAHVAGVEEAAAADVLVNATSVGMGAGGGLPFDAALLRPDHVVADIVYHPMETPLLAAARAAGALCVDGLGMLVHQAVLQQVLWTGMRPDPAAMRRAALARLPATDGQ